MLKRAVFQVAVIPFLFLVPAVAGPQTQAKQLFEEFHKTSSGSAELKDRFDDVSDAATATKHQKFIQYLARAKSLERNQLSKSDQLSLDLLIYLLNDNIEGFQWRYHQYPIDHVTGMHSQMTRNLMNKHPITEVADATNYILKINDMSRVLLQLQESLQTRASMGIIAPTFLLDRVLRDAQSLLAGEPFVSGQADNSVLADFKKKVSALTIAQAQKDRLVADVRQAMLDSMGPAYKKFFAYIQTTLRPLSDNIAGVHKWPKGNDFYLYMLKHHTSTTLTPDEIHNRGLEEVDAIHKALVRDMNELGFAGDISALFKTIREDAQFKYVPTEINKQKYRDTLRAILEKIEANLSLMFEDHLVPKAKYKVVEVTSGSSFYYSFPALDGSTPGIYYITVQDPNLPMMESLAYHEVVPGHHMNIAIQQEQVGVPDFRRVLALTAHGEGWGMYSEQLPNDLILGQGAVEKIGAYKDPVQRIGQALAALKKAIRLVVDTGMHHRGWTKERAAKYMADNSATPLESAMSDMDRYSIWPGQSTAYMIGYKQILDLRKKAVRELGPKFDIREFHTVMIGQGTLPLDMLETHVLDPWIASKKVQAVGHRCAPLAH